MKTEWKAKVQRIVGYQVRRRMKRRKRKNKKNEEGVEPRPQTKSFLASRLSEEVQSQYGYCVLPYQQAAPAAHNQSWGWMAGQAGSLKVFWAEFAVGKFFDGVCELNVQTVQPG